MAAVSVGLINDWLSTLSAQRPREAKVHVLLNKNSSLKQYYSFDVCRKNSFRLKL